jgi:hypothetical protein
MSETDTGCENVENTGGVLVEESVEDAVTEKDDEDIPDLPAQRKMLRANTVSEQQFIENSETF